MLHNHLYGWFFYFHPQKQAEVIRGIKSGFKYGRALPLEMETSPWSGVRRFRSEQDTQVNNAVSEWCSLQLFESSIVKKCVQIAQEAGGIHDRWAEPVEDVKNSGALKITTETFSEIRVNFGYWNTYISYKPGIMRIKTGIDIIGIVNDMNLMKLVKTTTFRGWWVTDCLMRFEWMWDRWVTGCWFWWVDL